MRVKRSRPAATLATLAAASLALAACGGQAGQGGQEANYPDSPVEIMVPADPGGGYDQTGRGIQRALREGGVTEEDVEVYNVSGGSGTVGLTQLVTENAGDPHQLMVMGKILVGAIEQTDAQVDLSQTTPIARLTAEYDAIAVSADSKYQSLDQLIEDFKANPGAISWGGGSVGGVDQILVGQLAQEIGVNPSNINYVPYSGGGELMPAVLANDVTVAVSGLAEFEDQLASGKMRLLAVSSEEPIEGVDAPTIIESGYDVSIANWRGIVAPPDISEDQRDAIVQTIESMHDTQQWQDTLESNNWNDYMLTGTEFENYIEQEKQDIAKTLSDLGVAE